MRKSTTRAVFILWLACFVQFDGRAVRGAPVDRSRAPSYYVKRDTWETTMLASLRAIGKSDLTDGFAAHESDILRGGQPAERLSVTVSGAGEMYLFVTGDPDVRWGVADWADARLVTKGGEEVRLSQLKSLEALEGRHSLDMTLRAGLYQDLAIAGRKFDHGLHVQANSVIRVPLDGNYGKFEAWIGVDAWAGTNGHVRFAVTGSKTAAARSLWTRLSHDFPERSSRRQMRWHREDRILNQAWPEGEIGAEDWAALAERYVRASHRVPPLARAAAREALTVRDEAGMARVREIYYQSRRLDDALSDGRSFNVAALHLAVEDLLDTYGKSYPEARRYLARLSALEDALQEALSKVAGGSLRDFESAAAVSADLKRLQREALLANPLLDFERLLVVKRKPLGDPRRAQWEEKGLGEYIGLPRQSSWGHGTMPRTNIWDNEIAVLSPVRPEGELTRVFKSSGRRLVTDVDLHFDADRMLFSMPDEHGRWQVHEIGTDGTGLRQLTPGDQPDVHSYDSCYLPDGRIAFISTAVLQGVPCNTSVIVGMMYRMEADGSGIQQVCFEQDHDYCPTVLNDGRVLYLRWDYTDTPHVWNRLLMSMNPDGTGQSEYYGSNSYWPNAIFFSRAIPRHPTKIVGIVTGHHEGRVGELIIFDPEKGRHEIDGVVQRIPASTGKVEPLIEDKLTEHSWPKFVYPYPLSEKYFLVASKPAPDDLWGIYLVDVFDNMVLVREEEHHVLLEPIPLRKTPTPPMIPDRVKPERKDALVYMANVYEGPGLAGIPRGAVTSLRVFTYHFGYQTLAGIDHRVGLDGPWEVKRVLGTVPVEDDGSAFFRVPAKTPISIQPLDAEGKALALMRSWMTAMPGEVLSCVGCHDHQNAAIPNRRPIAMRRTPSDIEPWRGPARGFSFRREVQPVLNRYCVGCHDGAPRDDRKTIVDLRADQGRQIVYKRGDPAAKQVRGVPKEKLFKKYGGVFEPSYVALRQYVRVGGLESDLHVLPPKEFHADTSELVQMLRKGHHNVRLDEEAWDRLITWIDLNAPCHGTWDEVARLPGNQRQRRQVLRRLYGGVDEDLEAVVELETPRFDPVIPEPLTRPKPFPVTCSDWPHDAAEARKRQAALGPATRVVDLGGGVQMSFVNIPTGSFSMGDPEGDLDEQPIARVEIGESFWMGTCEVTNEQFARFDPEHDSRFEHRSSWIFSERYLGWPLNEPGQPVVRVSWNQAMAFCRWLSEKTGARVTLPTEAQWEFACRAGTATPLFYGDTESDFSRFANVADATIREFAYEGWRPKAPDALPRDDRYDDGVLVTAPVGSYKPNAWGLHDMHGNAAEWTRSAYRPYPYRVEDGRETVSDEGRKVVRGGSWRDRPRRCRSGFRLSYPPYQRVFNVGFRVVIEVRSDTSP